MRARRIVWVVVIAGLCVPLWAQEDLAALEPCPPPEGSCAEDVALHVLDAQIGTWERMGSVIEGDPALLPELAPEDPRLLEIYRPVCAAGAQYRNLEGPGEGFVTILAFPSFLDAVGYFGAQRTEDATRVLVTSAAYRDAGVLHMQSSFYYFRIEVTGVPEQALPADQYLGARFEVRLPQRPDLPRPLRIMPRGWINSLTVSYEPVEILGNGAAPMAAAVRREIGKAQMRVRVIPAADEDEAARLYTEALGRGLERGQAWDVPRLGEEAFRSELDGDLWLVMLQDSFLVDLTSDGEMSDAEAVMRLMGTAVRVSRPLPGDVIGPLCLPAIEPAEAGSLSPDR
ncbi:MAG: hypothetical protein GX131_00100 [candidate division WS1 bacterium]|jgi:hypothetical protein|nr:hypothetical protein [candidate division WS1 bacterium]